MKNLTTQQHYEVPGGTLNLVLTTDHPLTTVELADLDQIADACAGFQARERSRHPDPGVATAPALEVDEAIWELGGEQGIMAGWRRRPS
jgi:hypothetical protein